MNVGRAFTYITSDPRWASKFATAVAIVFAQLFIQIALSITFSIAGLDSIGSLVSTIVGLAIGALLIGYMLGITRQVYDGRDTPLPEWDNAGEFYVHGWIVALGLLVWFSPLIALIVFSSIATAVGADVVSTVLLVGMCLLLPIVLIFWIFVFPIVFARYAVTRNFAAMFEVGEILKEIQQAPAALLINFGIMLVTGIIAGAGIIVCGVGLLVTMPYAYLVQAHMFGQVYRQARGFPAAAPSQAF